MSDSLELLDRNAAANLLGISNRTLDRLSDLPRVRLTERRIVYRRADIVKYIEQRVENGASS